MLGAGCPGQGLLCPPPASANLATVVIEDKPMGGPQEGGAVPPLAQGLHGKRLAQDHVVSHDVCVLERGGEAQGPWDGRLARPGGPVPGISPDCCCWPAPPESGWLARRWCRQWQPQSGEPACGARGRGQVSGVARLPSVLTLGASSLDTATGRAPLTRRPPSACPYLQQLPEEVEGRHGVQLLQQSLPRRHSPSWRQ